jgi:hypothetical protein
LLLSVRHARVARPACTIEVLLGRLDGTAAERVVHCGELSHDHHVGWTVRWLDEGSFVVRLVGGREDQYRVAARPTHAGALRVPVSSSEWIDHFRWNERHQAVPPWEDGAQVAPGELEAIAASLQEFQLGESSEGRHLMAGARDYAARTGDAAYPEAVELFIRVEQRHAQALARYMALAGVPTIHWSWADTVFRALRRAAGLRTSIAVMITAELIAKVCYPALREATRSPLLRAVCDQIIQDKIRHVEFMAERLAMLRRGRTRLRLALTHGMHRLLLAGTCAVVWLTHARALRAGGLNLARFWSETWRHFGLARERMDPRGYALK